MTQTSWTIGSDSSCDIVVESPTVSGRHCRLTADGSQLTLTDLESTNGTFVNGNQLSGSTVVSPADRVTLGQTEPLPWPAALRELAELRGPAAPHGEVSPDVGTDDQRFDGERLITIGRVSDNTVVLNHSNISSHHARLLINGDDLVLEDLGSTNGTSVGNVENKISRAKVTMTDRVFFGSTSYQVRQLINLANEGSGATSSSKQSKSSKAPISAKNSRGLGPPLSGRTVAVISAIVVLVLALLSLAWWGSVNGENQNAAVAPVDKPFVKPTEMKAAAAEPADAPRIAPSVIEPIEVVDNSPDATESDVVLARSLFVIVCSDPQNQTPFRVGTGFSIDANHIITSASVIDAMHDLNANGFPKSFLYSPATGENWDVRSMNIHPQYSQWNEKARLARQAHDEIFGKLEAEPPSPDAFEAVKGRLMDARMKAIDAIERKTAYDVGIITVDRPTQHWLSIADPSTSLRPNQKLTVTGYAFDVQDPYFDPTFPLEASEMQCRVVSLLNGPGESADRLLASATDEQMDDAFLGSPVVNANEKVVAIYSRPTPPVNDDADADPPMFDAALFHRINECKL